MKKINFNIKSSHLIILFIIFSFILNYFYYNKIFKKFHTEKNYLNVKLIENTNKIYENINNFNNSISIFEKIKKLKEKTVEKEYEVEYLKNKVKSKKNIIGIFRTLVLQNKMSIDEITLLTDKVEKNKGILIFKFTGKSDIRNFIKLLDILENSDNLLIIENYTLKPIPNTLNLMKVDMTLKFIYLATKG